jgi:uncharacterized SAM-binding protein YcdF (DUF218 family)
MFYILSKIFIFFLVPLNWLIILLIWWFLTKKQHIKKRIGIAALITFLFFSNSFIFSTLVKAWQPKPVNIPASNHYSAGIVLGGFASFDDDGDGHFNHAADRFIQVLKLYKQQHIQKIVVSGNSLREENGKADFVRQQLIIMGVASADIIIESQSKNTFENATFSRRLIDSAGLKPPYILITSALHVPRALKVFEKAAVPVIAYPCDYMVYDNNPAFEDFWPRADVLLNWTYFIKEVVGIMSYSLFNKA